MKKQFLKKSKFKFKKQKVIYAEKRPFLGDKEIIFRSSGRAKVFNISHRLQVWSLIVLATVFGWSGYNYYYYYVFEQIISSKEAELGKTRDAYIDLMTDVAVLQNNMREVVNSIAEADNGIDELNNYKAKAEIVEDKIKQIADSEAWIDPNHVEEKFTKKEALLQKEQVAKENDMLRQKITDLGNKINTLQETVKGLEEAEIVILEKIGRMSGKEIEQIKTSLSEINKALKANGRYFNPLANIKNNQGGAYIPAGSIKLENKELIDKLNYTFNQLDLLDNYKNALTNVPLGQPVYRYHISSGFGTRKDPFNAASAKHKGVDLGAVKGSRISVQAAGKVTTSGYNNGGYGNLVIIDHGNGFSTKYAHLNKIYVKKGDTVEYNQAIGEVGNTGRSTGSHLHYEVIYRGVPVNPLTFMKISSYNQS